MTISEATAYLLGRAQEVSSGRFPSFCRKAKVKLDAPLVHVAGSNGKGSTCFYLTEIATARYGKSVGTFYNSFLSSPLESICIGGEPVSEEEFLAHFSEGLPSFDKYRLTAFEILFFIACRLFQEKKVSVAIVECGMGGNDDPTNLDSLNTALAIVTNVSLEHTEYLGTTPSEIASNIAGIIAEERPVVIGPMDENSEEALRLACAKAKTALTRLERPHLPHLVGGESFVFDYPPFKDIALPTNAFYQVANACLAIEASKATPLLTLEETKLREALREGKIPGRLECVGDGIYLDCASNPAAIETLCRCFPSLSHGKSVHVLFACEESANLSVMLPLLDDHSSTVTLTTFPSPKARREEGFALYREDHDFVENPLMGLIRLQMSHPGEPIVITGCQAFVAWLRKSL